MQYHHYLCGTAILQLHLVTPSLVITPGLDQVHTQLNTRYNLRVAAAETLLTVHTGN